jgi:NADH-quinone oxidoreductase E subunit
VRDFEAVGEGIGYSGKGGIMDSALEGILSPYKGKKGVVVAVLQEMQEKLGYIAPEAVETMASELAISENEIYGVATFYSQFRFQPPGKHQLRVCLGTACHVRGAMTVLEELQRDLGIQAGETTGDGRFSLDTVMCLGACALGPVVVLDNDYHGQMTPAKARKLLDGLQKEARA